MMRFLIGVFTEHVATKFMALLLAIVLFAVVQQQLQSTESIDTIQLEFELAAELREDWTVMTKVVTLLDVKVTGRTSKLEIELKRLKQRPTQQIEIDERFLNAYPNKRNIRIDEQFLHDHDVLPIDIELAGERVVLESLRIERNEPVTIEIVLAAGMEERTRLRDDNPFEGTLEAAKRVDARFSIVSLKARAPESVFEGDTNKLKLHVTIRDVDTYLKDDYVGTGGQVTMPIDGFDWKASQIRGTTFATEGRFRIDGEWRVFDEMKRAINLIFEVSPKKEDVEAKLPIHYDVGPDKFDPLEGYRVRGPDGPINFTQQDIDNKKCSRFSLRVQKSVTQEDLKLFVLVLDVWRLEKQGDRIFVPVRLEVTDKNRGDLKRLVEIKMSSDLEGRPPRIEFEPAGG
ncbi:MAG: hypothetical protein ACYTGN_03460 [Planctomycetota bacterium]|jgi:hypothetical protein